MNWYIVGIIAAVWTAVALFFWALVHVGSRDDPEEWDG